MLVRYTDYIKRLQQPIRLLLGHDGAQPSFVIVGTQKGGTTILYSLLVEHPQILASARKEVQYFSLNFEKGAKWYGAQFPSKGAVQQLASRLGKPVITGEASPYYMFHPHATRRLAETLPNAKIIMILRDPVKRAVSHYHHNRARNAEPLPFADAIEQEASRIGPELDRMLKDEHYQSDAYRNFSYFARGNYAPQLKRVFDHFSRDQVLVLKSEELKSDTIKVYNQVCGFLGVDPFKPPLQVRANEGKYNDPIDPKVLETLAERYQPHQKELQELLGANYGW